MAAHKTSKSNEGYFAKYKTNNTFQKNRRIKLERLIKQQPNNEQLNKALADMRARRTTPKVPYWSHQMIRTATLFKLFTGRFDKDVFSNDPKVAHQASLAKCDKFWEQYTPIPTPKGSMFSIGAQLLAKEAPLV